MSELKSIDGVEIAKIYETNNFEQFQLKVGNRVVNLKHVKKLVKEIKEKDLKIPIEVDENLQIIDGQHRFFAYKELNKKFRFFVSPIKVEVKDIQTQNNVKLSWTLEDYMKSQIQMGNPHYIQLDKFRTKYNLALSDALLALGISKHTFRQGDLKIVSLEKAEGIILNMNKILANWEKTMDYKLNLGIITLLKNNPKLDVSTLIQRMVKYPSKYHSCTKVSEYVNMLGELYNYNTTKKFRLQNH